MEVVNELLTLPVVWLSLSLSWYNFFGENFTVMFQAQGFRYKSKTLEEIVQISRKQEGKLIGFDEKNSISNAADALQLEELQIGETSSSVTTLAPCSQACGNVNAEASPFGSNSTNPSKAHCKTTKRVSLPCSSIHTPCSESHGKVTHEASPFRRNNAIPIKAHGEGTEFEKAFSPHSSQATHCKAHGKEPALTSQLAERDCDETSEVSSHNSAKETAGMVLFLLEVIQGCFVILELHGLFCKFKKL